MGEKENCKMSYREQDPMLKQPRNIKMNVSSMVQKNAFKTQQVLPCSSSSKHHKFPSTNPKMIYRNEMNNQIDWLISQQTSSVSALRLSALLSQSTTYCRRKSTVNFLTHNEETKEAEKKSS
ncbi:uncharacterized protein LOC143250844 isoform X2 [Tachypleus tridentatus]|uniref:uncharacterized protein LOC143250844 isoform X2 n=1 Tax=Tachypleus tridentatus TaxID=6853 RepID=UPI003FD04A57